MRSAQGLMFMQSQRSVPALQKALSDPSARIRQSSLLALARIDADVTAFLEDYLEGERNPLNRKICKGLLERAAAKSRR